MPLHVHLRWGVTLVGKIQLLGIAHLVVGKKFRYWRHAKLIRDLSGEGNAIFGFILYFVKIWVENQVYVLCKEQRVVI